MGERHCTVCFIYYTPPTGRRCYRLTMGSNVMCSPTVFTQEQSGLNTVVSGRVSPISTPSTSASTAQAAVSKGDIILAELRNLAYRLTQVEQGLHSQSCTSTPKRKRKTKKCAF